MTTQLTLAKALRAQGIATIPVKEDKRPLVPWKRFMTELPTEQELASWFGKTDSALALVAGSIQAIDFDEKYAKGILGRFAKRAEEARARFHPGRRSAPADKERRLPSGLPLRRASARQ